MTAQTIQELIRQYKVREAFWAAADDLLEVVIRGYKNGFLTHHAAMIERKWLPEYEKWVGELMDDHDIDSDEYDDGHEYLYDGDPEFLLQMEPEREIEED